MSPEAHLLEADRAMERGDMDAALGHVRLAALAAGLLSGRDVAEQIAEDARIDRLSEAELAEELRALAGNVRLPAEVRARMALVANAIDDDDDAERLEAEAVRAHATGDTRRALELIAEADEIRGRLPGAA